jgi:hypothetical protein
VGSAALGAEHTNSRIHLRPSRSYPASSLFHALRRRSTRYRQRHLDVAEAAPDALAPATQSELELKAWQASVFTNHQLPITDYRLLIARRLAFNFREREGGVISLQFKT